MCIDFTKVDPLKDGKENILVLTDTITKFSQVFIAPNQKVIPIIKILVDEWLYVYVIPAYIHSDKDWSFVNDIMTHFYAIHRIEQSTTMPYNPCGNVSCERLNWTLIDLLKSCQKSRRETGHYIHHHWYLHIMPHHIVLQVTSLMY